MKAPLTVGVYELGQLLFESCSGLVYRATCQDAEGSFFIKTLGPDASPLHGRQRLQKEFNLSRCLAVKSSLFLSPQEFINEEIAAIVWEDRGLIPLKQFLPREGLAAHEFLPLARQCAQMLHELHCADFLHRDLATKNILINPRSHQLFFLDFGASRSCREIEENRLPARTGYPVWGTYQYMSPEHTGKVDRAVDFRSDLYSTGVVFFKMLSGQTPLEGITSRLALLFGHVAVEFPQLHLLQTKHRVPLVVSRIVAKLVEKEPARRYQSAWGLLHDLNLAANYLHVFSALPLVAVPLSEQLNLSSDTSLTGSQEEWPIIRLTLEEKLRQLTLLQKTQSEGGWRTAIPEGSQERPMPFELGSRDRSVALLPPIEIHGRDAELDQITELYQEAMGSDGNVFGVIVSGYSGCGKR